jgi:soluble lytic murein transglycosylase-like protein
MIKTTLLFNGTLLLAAMLLSVNCLSAEKSVPTNTIIGSSGKKMQVKNRYAPNPQNQKIKVYKYSDGGTASFSDRAPQGKTYEVIAYKCFACDVNSTVDWYNIALYRDKFSSTIELASQEHKVNPALVRAVIHAESAFRPDAQSQVGAAGLMQLMPLTANELGVQDRFDPTQNIYGGVKYLAQLLALFDNNIQLATAAYNAGPNAVKRYGGIPPYAETQAYVERVGILMKRYGS